MPYEDVFNPAQGMDARQALACARLNLRGAKRLLQKGSLKRGISALYDSVLFGMHYYVSRHADCKDVDLGNAAGLFHLLTQEGIFEDQHAFNRLSLSVERALWQGSDYPDANAILLEVEEMLAKLNVLAFPKSFRNPKSNKLLTKKEGGVYL